MLILSLSTFRCFWGRRQVRIYLFRDQSTDTRAHNGHDRAQHPLVTSATVWLFVEAYASAMVGHRVFAIRGAPGRDNRLLSLRARLGTTSYTATC